jgi:hypothetical protein
VLLGSVTPQALSLVLDTCFERMALHDPAVLQLFTTALGECYLSVFENHNYVMSHDDSAEKPERKGFLLTPTAQAISSLLQAPHPLLQMSGWHSGFTDFTGQKSLTTQHLASSSEQPEAELPLEYAWSRKKPSKAYRARMFMATDVFELPLFATASHKAF